MNVLIVADTVTFSGVGNYIKVLCKGLVERGHKVVVLSPKNDIKIEDTGAVYEKLGRISKNPIAIQKNVSIISKTVKKYEIDIAHAQHRMSAFILHQYKRFHKLPVVYTIHTSKWPMNAIKKWFGYYGDRAIAISTECKQFLSDIAKVKENKIAVVYNGVDNSVLEPSSEEQKRHIRETHGVPQEKTVICMHGRLDPVKGIDKTLDAIASLPEEYKNKVYLVLSGNTDCVYYSKLINLVEQYGLQNNVKFLGWCDSTTILGMSDLMVAPSHREGFSLSCIEAMFMRVPIVRSKTGGYLNMQSCVDGLERNEPDVIADRIKAFIDDSHIYDDMVDKAVELAENNFTSDCMVERTIDVYESVMSEKKIMFDKLRKIEWAIAVRKRSDRPLYTGGGTEASFTLLKNTSRYWAADPFLFENDGYTYLLFEMYDRLKRRGCLGVRTLKSGKFSRMKKIYDIPYHLSYPNVFKADDGNIYLIPECHECKEIFVLQAVEFPYKWKKVKTLMKGEFADTTILSYNGQNYLFTTPVDSDNVGKLVIYTVNAAGEVTPVTFNPAVVDRATARQGGNFIYTEDKILRVSQDCSNGYGGGLNFMKLGELSESVYTESLDKKVLRKDIKVSGGDKFLDGVHTYNLNDEFEVIDLKRAKAFHIIELIGFMLTKIGFFKRGK